MFGYLKSRSLMIALGILVAHPAKASAVHHAPTHTSLSEFSSTMPETDIVFRAFEITPESNFIKSFTSPVRVHVGDFFRRLTADEAATVSLRDLSAQRKALRAQDAVIGEILEKKQAGAELDPVKERLTGHSSRVLGQSISDKLGVFAAFQSGFQFNMNLKNLFGSEGPSPEAPPELRYGLVLKNIEPSADSINQAASGEFRAEDLAYAGQAKVSWTIEPILRRPDAPLFSVRTSQSEYDDENADGFLGLIKSISLPDPEFTGHVTPKSSGLSGGVPPLKVTIEQKQGYYWTEVHSRSNFKKDFLLHGVRVPFYKAAHVQQIFNESFDPEKTSVCNILGEAHRPIVNVNFHHPDERFTGDLFMVRKRWIMGFTAEAAPRSNPISDFGKGHGERYEVKVGTDF